MPRQISHSPDRGTEGPSPESLRHQVSRDRPPMHRMPAKQAPNKMAHSGQDSATKTTTKQDLAPNAQRDLPPRLTTRDSKARWRRARQGHHPGDQIPAKPGGEEDSDGPEGAEGCALTPAEARTATPCQSPLPTLPSRPPRRQDPASKDGPNTRSPYAQNPACTSRDQASPHSKTATSTTLPKTAQRAEAQQPQEEAAILPIACPYRHHHATATLSPSS